MNATDEDARGALYTGVVVVALLFLRIKDVSCFSFSIVSFMKLTGEEDELTKILFDREIAFRLYISLLYRMYNIQRAYM